MRILALFSLVIRTHLNQPDKSESPQLNQAEFLIFLILTLTDPNKFFGWDRVWSLVGVEYKKTDWHKPKTERNFSVTSVHRQKKANRSAWLS